MQIFPIFEEFRRLTADLDDTQFGKAVRYALGAYFGDEPGEESEILVKSPFRGESMKEQLHLKNHLKEVRMAANLSQAQLAEMVGVSRNTISSIETGQFNPTAKLALILCIALDKKFEELFYF